MRFLRDVFYGGATQTGIHAFIEFAGLMTMFIDGCAAAEAEGRPWAHADVHSGSHLPLTGNQLDYLREKLVCIYGTSFETAPSKPVNGLATASPRRAQRPRANTARAQRRAAAPRTSHG
ncbi:MAG TPA: hypothetical protein VFP84_17895 [Kofleriaceae bacterium]|nr:hypothetical protein [Kofleriaceae bacterium]